MTYICDGCDIYVIYVCMNLFVMMECKKNKKLPFWVTLPSVALGKRTPLPRKKIQTLPSAGQGALGKEFLEKNKTSLPRAR